MKYSHLTDYQIGKIIGCFYLDLTATQGVEITGFNRNTIDRFFNIFRKSILTPNSAQSYPLYPKINTLLTSVANIIP
ncbi:hypothetical protein FACS1894152_3870 [Bacilli bacterium]|nr:hypothetical protein FACS1894152_3870 [Bacilli bacterium]